MPEFVEIGANLRVNRVDLDPKALRSISSKDQNALAEAFGIAAPQKTSAKAKLALRNVVRDQINEALSFAQKNAPKLRKALSLTENELASTRGRRQVGLAFRKASEDVEKLQKEVSNLNQLTGSQKDLKLKTDLTLALSEAKVLRSELSSLLNLSTKGILGIANGKTGQTSAVNKDLALRKKLTAELEKQALLIKQLSVARATRGDVAPEQVERGLIAQNFGRGGIAGAIGNVGNLSGGALETELNRLKEFSGTLKETTKRVRESSNAFKQHSFSFRDFGDQSALAVKRYAAYLFPTTGLFAVISGVRESIEEFKEFERVQTSLQQVLGGSDEVIASLSRRLSSLSVSTGQSLPEIGLSSRLLAQAGFGRGNAGSADITGAVEQITRAQLGPSFESIEKSTEGLIAVFSQFNLELKDTGRVLDVTNQLSKDFAVESADILESVKRGGSVFATLGGDFEDFAGLLTLLRAETRESAQQLGTFFKSSGLKLFSQDAKDIFATLERGDDILRTTTFGDRLRALSGAFDELSSGQRVVLAERLVGRRQGGRLLAILNAITENSDKLADSLSKADGSVDRDAARRLDDLSVAYEKLGASIRQFFRSIVENPVVTGIAKLFADISSSLTNLLSNAGGVLGTVLTAGAAIVGFKAVPEFAKGFSGRLFGGAASTATTSGLATSPQTAATNRLIAAIERDIVATNANTSALGGNTTSGIGSASVISSGGRNFRRGRNLVNARRRFGTFGGTILSGGGRFRTGKGGAIAAGIGGVGALSLSSLFSNDNTGGSFAKEILSGGGQGALFGSLFGGVGAAFGALTGATLGLISAFNRLDEVTQNRIDKNRTEFVEGTLRLSEFSDILKEQLNNTLTDLDSSLVADTSFGSSLRGKSGLLRLRNSSDLQRLREGLVDPNLASFENRSGIISSSFDFEDLIRSILGLNASDGLDLNALTRFAFGDFDRRSNPIFEFASSSFLSDINEAQVETRNLLGSLLRDRAARNATELGIAPQDSLNTFVNTLSGSNDELKIQLNTLLQATQEVVEQDNLLSTSLNNVRERTNLLSTVFATQSASLERSFETIKFALENPLLDPNQIQGLFSGTFTNPQRVNNSSLRTSSGLNSELQRLGLSNDPRLQTAISAAERGFFETNKILNALDANQTLSPDNASNLVSTLRSVTGQLDNAEFQADLNNALKDAFGIAAPIIGEQIQRGLLSTEEFAKGIEQRKDLRDVFLDATSAGEALTLIEKQLNATTEQRNALAQRSIELFKLESQARTTLLNQQREGIQRRTSFDLSARIRDRNLRQTPETAELANLLDEIRTGRNLTQILSALSQVDLSGAIEQFRRDPEGNQQLLVQTRNRAQELFSILNSGLSEATRNSESLIQKIKETDEKRRNAVLGILGLDPKERRLQQAVVNQANRSGAIPQTNRELSIFVDALQNIGSGRFQSGTFAGQSGDEVISRLADQLTGAAQGVFNVRFDGTQELTAELRNNETFIAKLNSGINKLDSEFQELNTLNLQMIEGQKLLIEQLQNFEENLTLDLTASDFNVNVRLDNSANVLRSISDAVTAEVLSQTTEQINKFISNISPELGAEISP